jgi:hypothetical protein
VRRLRLPERLLRGPFAEQRPRTQTGTAQPERKHWQDEDWIDG